jgi:Flp pilus assembly pilin Flp
MGHWLWTLSRGGEPRILIHVALRQLIHVALPGTLRRLWQGEPGQDLVEYTLMVAFLAMASATIFFSAGGNINVVRVSASSTLQGAANPGVGKFDGYNSTGFRRRRPRGDGHGGHGP